jgi:hypothetical protein
MQGGVAERLKYREATDIREAGGFPMKTLRRTTLSASIRWLRSIFLMTHPPLLAVMQGGEDNTPQKPAFAVEIIVSLSAQTDRIPLANVQYEVN